MADTPKSCPTCGKKRHLVTAFPVVATGKELTYTDKNGIHHQHPPQFVEWTYWCQTETCPPYKEQEQLEFFCCSS